MSRHEQPPPRSWWRRPGVVTLVPAAIVFVVYIVNLRHSYDVSLDEITYGTAGQHVIDHNSVSAQNGPLLVHPPVYFVLAGVWQAVIGRSGSSVLDAVYGTRYLQALIVAALAWAAGMTTSAAVRASGRRVRLWQPLSTMALTAFSALLLAFGRAVILEPLALLAGVAIVWAALRLHDHRALTQVCVLGVAVGVGCLVKQTVVFAGVAPLLAALLRRDGRRVRIQVGVVAVGAVVWSSFLFWAIAEGRARRFGDQQSVSVRRLLGLLHTSGVNQPGKGKGTVGAFADFRDTFGQYLGGYVIMVAGGLALLVLLVRRATYRRDESPVEALVLSLGLLNYAFVVFSFAFGQGNEQLILYAVVPAAVAAVYVLGLVGLGHRDRSAARALTAVAALFAVVGVVLGVVTWVRYYVVRDDDATAQMAAYVEQRYPSCVTINASGTPVRWDLSLPGDNVTAFSSGPQAQAAGVRLYLLSTKDASHAYGTMSPPFAQWIRAHGTELTQFDGRSYGRVSLWQTGRVTPISSPRCSAGTRDHPASDASALVFLGILAGELMVVAVVFVAAGRRRSRRERVLEE